MKPWHLDDELARRYAAGAVEPVLAASVEAHLMACGTCRENIAGAVPAERLAAIWQGVAGSVRARPTLIQRLRDASAWWRPLPVVAALVVLALAVMPGRSEPAATATPRPGTTVHPAWNAHGGTSLATLTARLVDVDGRLIYADGEPPARIALDDGAAAVVDRSSVTVASPGGVPPAAVIHGMAATWIYRVAGRDLIVRERVTATAGPAPGTRIVIFPVG